ncbi:MAG: hypothetical protein OEM04_02695 [Flavobacteriaceae bacterium]|nr:hypothetical protein [Flavobacteriaceae bacterium]
MKKAGIWLDQKEANIITLLDDSLNNKTIYSEIETRERFEGEKRQYGRFGSQYLNNEQSKANKLAEQTNRYLNSIISELNKVDEFFVFGPSQTKIKLEKLILDNPDLSSKLNEIMNAEKMSQNQKIAFVKDYFKD